jgi:hypothetical protein
MSGVFYWRRCATSAEAAAKRTGGGPGRLIKPYNIVRDISTNGSGQWLGGAYLVKAAPRE